MRRSWNVVKIAVATICFATPGYAALTVSTRVTQNVSCSSGVCTATAKNAFMSYLDLQAMLASGDVTLLSPSLSGDIVVSHAFHWASAQSLTLDTSHSIQIDAAVADQGAGGVTLVTNDGGTGGTLSFGNTGALTFLGTSNALSINGQSYTLVGDIATLASGIASSPSGNFALAHSYDAKADGVYTSTPITTTFTGRFEGLGNMISRFTIGRSKTAVGYQALFKETDIGSSVENLVLQGEKIDLAGKASGFAGLTTLNGGNIFGVRVDLQGTVSGLPHRRSLDCLAAGVVGFNGGTVDHSSSSGSVTCGGSPGYLGGLVAFGYMGSVIENSHSSVAVTGGTETAERTAEGGLVGWTYGNVTSSYASGAVSGGVNGSYYGGANVGGLVGIAAGGDHGLIANSYATGSVTGAGDLTYAGGLIGYDGRTGPPGDQNNQDCYSTGLVSGGVNTLVGGLVGDMYGVEGLVDTYWDMDTSGVNNPTQGAGNRDDETGVTGLTDAQLKSGLPSGFSSSVWGQNPAINNGWPYLLSNPPQ
jgi:hypothetical protein